MILGAEPNVGVAVALAVGLAVALAACNLIVGVGDYAVGDAAVDGTTVGDEVPSAADVVADRGETGAGIADAVRAEADVTLGDASVADMTLDGDGSVDAAHEQGGDATDGSSAESSSAADADDASHDAEAGPDCGQAIPTGQADFQQLVSACMFSVSCDPYLFPISLSTCITQNALQAAPSFTCLSTITSCTGSTNSFYSCEGFRYATTSECPALVSTCDTVNNVAIDCNYTGLAGIVTDCSRTPTSSCQTYADSGTSSKADCVVVNSCPNPDAGVQCSGNNGYSCVALDDGGGGVGVGRNCGTATCVTSAGCQFNGTTTCTDAGSATCSGNTLQACDTPGQAFNYDCTRAGGSCAADNTGKSACVSPGCSVGSTCAETCNRTTNALTICVGGAPYAVSCAQYGFSSCGSDTISGYVYCQP
jgi:hypothetical protein